MKVVLTPELEDFVRRKVESGRFQSPSEVIGESLRLLQEHDEFARVKQEELRKDIAAAIEQADNGQLAPLDLAGTWERVKKGRPHGESS